MMTNLVHLRTLRESNRFERENREQRTRWSAGVDAGGLAEALRVALRGEVRFDRGSRALYATDGSNYRQVPIGVVVPRDVGDVIRTVELARQFGAPILNRGGGTSLAGQCCNVAVLMDYSKYMHHVLEIDEKQKLGRVQPGCVLDDLRAAAMKKGLTFGPDPATHSRCTLGGMLGNNSCGSHSHLSAKEGRGYRTSDNTHELEILTYDGLRMRVSPTSDDELETIIRAGGRRGQIYADLRKLRDKYANLIRERFPRIPRRVSGYNLNELLPENGFHVARALVGTESTCVTILEAQLHLVHNPKARSLLLLGYPDVFQAGDHVMDILPFGPTACEGVDELLFQWEKQRGGHQQGLSIMPEGHGWLFVEFGGDTKQQSDDAARRCMEALKGKKRPPSMKLFDNPDEEKLLWDIRESSLGATAWVPGHKDTWEGFEDSAVAPEYVGEYLRKFKKLLDKFEYDTSLYGHLGQGCVHCRIPFAPEYVGEYLRKFKKLLDKFEYDTSLYGHLGQGCVHCRIPFDFYTQPGVEKYRRFMDEATDLVLSLGGSLSGEHGDGQSRAEFLPKMFGAELVEAFREFKRIWDPQWKMNPGKVVDPYSISDNLRLGPDYHPPQPDTHFRYPTDQHAFSRAILRCVGIGACRNEGGQTMCPSYMVTREEKHSTRGRARLLWEMMNGDVIEDGWKSEEVKNALDLCLSCKGCKHDCPVNVDMATYKAEFLSHYYEGRLRPRHAFAFGFIHVWATLVHAVPGLATISNWLTRAPGLSALAKQLAGMHQKREIPRFAPKSFKSQFARRRARQPGRPEVLLFADTFNDHFLPDTLWAGVDVLELTGFQVVVPMQDLCCGRPLYDYGFVPTAKRWLQHFMDTMRPAIQAGLPMVVLEPSCAAVFRDELPNLFPADKDAQRLSEQTFLLSEFLAKKAPHFRPPPLKQRVLLHGHCHHKNIMGMEDEKKLLQNMGAQIDAPEDGCCGMAGAFGYEKGDHYDVSIKCGERVLLPEVRSADRETLIVTDGFSCREQIQQETNRHALHLAHVIQMAAQGESALANGSPEATIVRNRNRAHRQASMRTVLGLAGVAAAGFMIYHALTRNKNGTQP